MQSLVALFLRWCSQLRDFGIQHLCGMRSLQVMSLAGNISLYSVICVYSIWLKGKEYASCFELRVLVIETTLYQSLVFAASTKCIIFIYFRPNKNRKINLNV